MAGESVYTKKPWLKSYEKGVPEFVQYEDICLPDILERTAKQFPEKPALIFQGYTVNFRQLKDMVEQLPKGLDTIVGLQGVRLSGGQRQRLAIARMILAKPQVVILDEATSALDAETEARLHEALRAFLKDRTTIIVAHRLSAVKQADRVYVFEDGRIIEEGAHEELLKNKGLYSRLYGQLQH